MLQFRAIRVLGLIALLAATLGGCTIGEEPTAETSPSPTAVAPSPTTAAPSPAKSPVGAKPTPGKAGKTPVPPKPAPVGATVTLIQPTNPDVRAGQVSKGRNDPFSVIPVNPVRKPVKATPKPPTKLPTLPNSGSGRPNRVGKPKPELPPLPDPILAKAVEVMGVVQVGNSYQIIVKSPEEATSRYVRVGQRLANGQVLVKRVEANFGADPVVILEEQGVEVARRVGEAAQVPTPAAAPPPPEPQATLPYTPMVAVLSAIPQQ